MLKHIRNLTLYTSFLVLVFVIVQTQSISSAKSLSALDGSPSQESVTGSSSQENVTDLPPQERTTEAPPLESTPSTVVSDPQGTAELELNGNLLTIHISLTGLAPNSTHPAHIHSGSCEQHPEGPILYPLPNITADEQGNAMLDTTLTNFQLPDQPISLNVHNGPTLDTDEQKMVIACGDISFTGTHATVSLGQTSN
ncbi:CHRD domain-containing protein [Ktedonospora formicarum]|uniref:CHRD domain-containing protein n=1 Tax=Ktedonospora formicarum TaxID=2778364 RepID=A0A8J3I4R9_9CHLR|nr:CHRD domain-containing protein [Ktedonospora formicarum]GHO45918.1 hypothetical protein KSX_40810 [Ktedonospora formicarum]